MEKEFCTYNQALRLKALGFDEPCFGFHSKIHGLMMVKTSGSSSLYKDAGECLAPTYSQAFRWLRNEYLLNGVPDNWKNQWCFEIVKLLDSKYLGNKKHHEWAINSREDYNKLYSTYEEAELACLEKLLEIVESKKVV